VEQKDPTEVGRAAGCGLADECPLQLAYWIGVVDPVPVMGNTFSRGQLPDVALAKLVRKVFPLSLRGMIEHPGPRWPRYLGNPCPWPLRARGIRIGATGHSGPAAG